MRMGRGLRACFLVHNPTPRCSVPVAVVAPAVAAGAVAATARNYAAGSAAAAAVSVLGARVVPYRVGGGRKAREDNTHDHACKAPDRRAAALCRAHLSGGVVALNEGRCRDSPK